MPSDSGDDFESYNPTTPFKPPPKKPSGRAAKVITRAVAGPSSKPASETRKHLRKRTRKSPEQSDVEEADIEPERMEISSGHEDEEDEEISIMPPPKAKQPIVNGKVGSKEKGKAKAQPSTKTSRKTTAAEYLPEEDIELVVDSDEAPVKPTQSNSIVRKPRKVNSTAQQERDVEVSSKELDSLRKKLSDVETQRETLSKQLEELFSIRQTAPETALEERSAQYEARLKTQESLIQELTSQLARVEPLTRTGKTPLLYFLTREAADEEKRNVEKEVSQWKDVADGKDALLRQKDERIAELEQAEKDLQHELALEIERSKTLAIRATKGPPSASRRALGTDNPKDLQVVKLYEDLSNLLVISMKFEPGDHGEETVFTCVYSYVAKGRDEPDLKSLSFSLRVYKDLVEDSLDQFTEIVKYTPADLDKEAPEFVQNLDFLNAPFTFQRTQLPIFLNTLYNTMGGILKENEEEGEGDEEMEDGEPGFLLP